MRIGSSRTCSRNAGFGDAGLDALAEFSLRTLHSPQIDPGARRRKGNALRRFVARWLAPAILYPRLAQAMTAMQGDATPLSGLGL